MTTFGRIILAFAILALVGALTAKSAELIWPRKAPPAPPKRLPVVYLRHGDDGQTVYAGHGGDIEIVPLDDATRAAFGP